MASPSPSDLGRGSHSTREAKMSFLADTDPMQFKLSYHKEHSTMPDSHKEGYQPADGTAQLVISINTGNREKETTVH